MTCLSKEATGCPDLSHLFRIYLTAFQPIVKVEDHRFQTLKAVQVPYLAAVHPMRYMRTSYIKSSRNRGLLPFKISIIKIFRDSFVFLSIFFLLFISFPCYTFIEDEIALKTVGSLSTTECLAKENHRSPESDFRHCCVAASSLPLGFFCFPRSASSRVMN